VGGVLAKHVLPGDSERGKGGSLARKFGGSYSRVDLACFHGKTFWRVCLAGQFGTFIWRVFISNEKDMLLNKKEKKKSKGMYYSESVDCNVII
jgi:hypothetical protein